MSKHREAISGDDTQVTCFVEPECHLSIPHSCPFSRDRRKALAEGRSSNFSPGTHLRLTQTITLGTRLCWQREELRVTLRLTYLTPKWPSLDSPSPGSTQVNIFLDGTHSHVVSLSTIPIWCSAGHTSKTEPSTVQVRGCLGTSWALPEHPELCTIHVPLLQRPPESSPTCLRSHKAHTSFPNEKIV